MRLRVSAEQYEQEVIIVPGDAARLKMDILVVEYNLRLRKIWLEYQMRRNDNFAVVLDPLLKDIQMKEWGMESVSRFDCFHPSVKTHSVIAQGLWNNLMRPFSLKRMVTKNTVAECPSWLSRIWTV